MNVLVTGGAGFIGPHFVDTLLRHAPEARVVCVDNFNDYYDPALKRDNGRRVAALPGVELVELDFCDRPAIDRLFDAHAFTHIMHLGAYAGVRVSVDQPLVYAHNNVVGTLTLLEAARRNPVERFVLVSSSTVYGKGAAVPFREDQPLGTPASPYGASKRATELFGLTYHQLHQVPVVCCRPFSVYGPGLRPDLALSIFTDRILRGEEIPLFGDGSIRRDMTHVSDICQGLWSALTRPDVEGLEINLGHSDPIEMREVIDRLAAAADRPANIRYLPAREEDLPITFADLRRARALLHYAPKVPFSEGAVEFVQWYRGWHQL